MVMGLEQDMRLCGEPNCEDFWIECAVCGCEFCRKCFPGATLCPDCAEEATTAITAEEDDVEPDFEDVKDLNALMRENNE